jgi:hypothetical protein
MAAGREDVRWRKRHGKTGGAAPDQDGGRRGLLSPFRKVDKKRTFNPFMAHVRIIFFLTFFPRRPLPPPLLPPPRPAAAAPSTRPPPDLPPPPPFLIPSLVSPVVGHRPAASPPTPAEPPPPPVLRLPPSRSAGQGDPRTRTPNPETLTLRSVASTTTPAGGDLVAGRSPPHPTSHPTAQGSHGRRRQTG